MENEYRNDFNWNYIGGNNNSIGRINMKRYLLLLIAFFSSRLFAQENEIDSTSSHWNFSAWAEMFIIPQEEDFFNPTIYARHKTLHLEGRYNYEDRNTASFWAGRRFKFGKP